MVAVGVGVAGAIVDGEAQQQREQQQQDQAARHQQADEQQIDRAGMRGFAGKPERNPGLHRRSRGLSSVPTLRGGDGQLGQAALCQQAHGALDRDAHDLPVAVDPAEAGQPLAAPSA